MAKRTFFLFLPLVCGLVLLPSLFGFHAPADRQYPNISISEYHPSLLDCDPPQSASWFSPAAGTLSVSWSQVAGAQGYRLVLVPECGSCQSQEIETTATSHVFTSLPSGKYQVKIATLCGSTMSGFIVIVDIIL